MNFVVGLFFVIVNISEGEEGLGLIEVMVKFGYGGVVVGW